jgi:hypothetical protein
MVEASLRSSVEDATRAFSSAESEKRFDPVISAWQTWHAALRRQAKLCERQQILEKKLLERVGGFPQVKLNVPHELEPVSVRAADEIDRLLPGRDVEATRNVAKSELLAVRNAWDAADEEMGYTTTYDAETKASERTVELAEALWNMQALAVPGIIAKLHCLIEMEDPGAGQNETPWPELRFILLDLLRLDTCVRL